MKFLLGLATGAALAYFLDPDRGTRRRNMARDRALALARRTASRVEDQANYAASTLQGQVEKMRYQSEGLEPPANDATLASKVESELFRDPNIPKGSININAEYGVVKVRGEVPHPEDIERIERRIRSIPGVVDVENLLHLPNTPAPTTPYAAY